MLTDLIQPMYNRYVRPFCPRKPGMYNGVVSPAPKLLDRTDHIPEYKNELLWSIREAVRPGDHVVVIGGGKGIASVIAGRSAAPDGRVITYEAREEQAKICSRAMAMNRIHNWTTVPCHVDTVLDETYDGTTGSRVDATDLPPHSVLVMDCEGAETSIIEAIGTLDGGEPGRPDTIVVETHTEYEAPPDVVGDALDSAGFEVNHEAQPTWAHTDSPDRILTATTDDAGPIPDAYRPRTEVETHV